MHSYKNDIQKKKKKKRNRERYDYEINAFATNPKRTHSVRMTNSSNDFVYKYRFNRVFANLFVCGRASTTLI